MGLESVLNTSALTLIVTTNPACLNQFIGKMEKIVQNKTSRLMTSALIIYVIYTLAILTCVECRRHRSTTEPTSSSNERHHPHGHGHNRRHHGSRRNSNKICIEREEDIERIKELRSGCKCPTIHAPVCGSNGITYHNRCYLECASEATYHRFRQRPITLEKWGPCEESMRSIEKSSERTSSSSFSTAPPEFGLHFWEKECPYINKRENCTPRVKSFCSEDFPQVIRPGPGISLDGK